jgi:hypothetical protein
MAPLTIFLFFIFYFLFFIFVNYTLPHNPFALILLYFDSLQLAPTNHNFISSCIPSQIGLSNLSNIDEKHATCMEQAVASQSLDV